MSAVLRAVDTLADKREPPYSSEAEHSVLGGLLLDNSRWHDAATLLTAADFYHHEHGAIFAAITAIIEADVGFDCHRFDRGHRRWP